MENGVEFLPDWPELIGELSLLGKQNLCMGHSLFYTLSPQGGGGGEGRGGGGGGEGREVTSYIYHVSSMVETYRNSLLFCLVNFRKKKFV